MTKTFVDAGVLIAAVRGNEAQIRTAVAVLRDPTRTFVASAFLRLELLPKPLFFRNQIEARFYEDFFAQVSFWSTENDQIIEVAERVAAQHGLNALDALHVAAAFVLGADEMVTTEGVNKSLRQ